MLVSMTELLQEANEKQYAIGAFNAVNLESLTAIIQAAEETGHGVILNHAEAHFPLTPLEIIGPVMVDMAKKAKVPVCVHLDHGQTLEVCMQAIQMGFSSVMLDASSNDYEENVQQTALLCRLAHSIGVTVEAELGHIFQADIGVGESSVVDSPESYENAEDLYTDPDTAKDFVERTGVDALAIAFGTSHGVYKTKPKLDLDRIRLVREKVDVPLVMHGGSGLTKEEFQTAIRNGIRKLNYYTYMTVVAGKAVKEFIDSKAEDETIFFHELPPIAIAAMREDVKQAIRIFSLEV